MRRRGAAYWNDSDLDWPTNCLNCGENLLGKRIIEGLVEMVMELNWFFFPDNIFHIQFSEWNLIGKIPKNIFVAIKIGLKSANSLVQVEIMSHLYENWTPPFDQLYLHYSSNLDVSVKVNANHTSFM